MNRVDKMVEDNEKHLRQPQPGDLWHERFCPYHLVLAVTEKGVVITDKTIPAGPSHYTFDHSKAREITHGQHESLVRYSSGRGFVADVVPERVIETVREWKAAGSDYEALP